MEEKNFITLEDFQKVDLRIAKIKEVHPHPKSSKMIVLVLDTGDNEVQVLAGIKQWYSESELVGKTVVYVANLQPKVIGGLESNGMILAAGGDVSKPLLLTVEGDIALNSRVR